jgi:hypothetical protein
MARNTIAMGTARNITLVPDNARDIGNGRASSKGTTLYFHDLAFSINPRRSSTTHVDHSAVIGGYQCRPPLMVIGA